MITILIQKILSLAIIMAMGWAIVKLKVLKQEDSLAVSKLTMYLILPCMTLSAFQVDFTPEVRDGLILAVAAAVGIHVVMLVIGVLLKKLLRLEPVELLSAIYSNAGNLVVPIVGSVLGKEWLIYTSAFSLVQLTMLWSHGKAVMCEERGFDIRKIVSNPNMIAIGAGVVMLVTGLRLPGLLRDTVETVGGTIGPVGMLFMGMLISKMELKQVFTYKRVWLITALRLVVLPLLILCLLKYTGIADLVPGGKDVLLVTLLAVVAPSASTVPQMAQVYGKDAAYASAINVVTTLVCIVTIPVMVMLYRL